MRHGVAPDHQRIVLVGFMAAGKTAVGRRLAERLGWDFIDFDDEVLRRTGRSAGDWIREDGEASLRHLEASLTDELARRDQVVLAPGGGWATTPAATGMRGSGTVVVWLRVSAVEAVRRAEAEGTDRPLLGDPAGAAALLGGRERYYGAADLVVETEGVEVDRVAGEILRRLGYETGG